MGRVLLLATCPVCGEDVYAIVDENPRWLARLRGMARRGIYPCMYCERCGGKYRRYGLLARLRYLLWRKVDLRCRPEGGR